MAEQEVEAKQIEPIQINLETINVIEYRELIKKENDKLEPFRQKRKVLEEKMEVLDDESRKIRGVYEPLHASGVWDSVIRNSPFGIIMREFENNGYSLGRGVGVSLTKAVDLVSPRWEPRTWLDKPSDYDYVKPKEISARINIKNVNEYHEASIPSLLKLLGEDGEFIADPSYTLCINSKFDDDTDRWNQAVVDLTSTPSESVGGVIKKDDIAEDRIQGFRQEVDAVFDDAATGKRLIYYGQEIYCD